MTKDEASSDSAGPEEPDLADVVDESPSEQATPIPLQIRPKLPPYPSILKTRNALIRPFRRSSPKFHKFPLLPVEIRLQIWEAAFVPRVHELHPCAKLYNERMTFRSNASRTPAIFHACHESRKVALQNHQLMEYEPPRSGTSGKGILRFYFCPAIDTLLLNSLMGLFIMFMLLEDEEDYVGVGVMKGWQRVAFDADRAQLISLLSGIAGHAPQPRFKEVFPSLKELIIALDYTRKGKTRFRTSVWPGENGTSLTPLTFPPHVDTEAIFKPMRDYLENDYAEEVPSIEAMAVKRKAFIRGDIRYGFRKTCSFFGLRPRGVFRRL